MLGATEFHYSGQDGPSAPGVSQMGTLLAAVSSTCPEARGQKTYLSYCFLKLFVCESSSPATPN